MITDPNLCSQIGTCTATPEYVTYDECSALFYCDGISKLADFFINQNFSGNAACFRKFESDMNGFPFCINGLLNNPWGKFGLKFYNNINFRMF